MNLRYYRNQSTLTATLADRAHEEMVMKYNERMKTEYPGDVIFYDMFNQRFAELIVQECCDKFVDMQHQFHPSICAYEIKKHFGVEE